MKTEFNRNELAAIKRAAANIAPFIAKRNKVLLKRAVLQQELDDINKSIEMYNTPVKALTGYNTEELIDRVEGKFVFKYPDTIIPTPNLEDLPAGSDYDLDATIEEVETSPKELPFNLPY